MWEVCASTLCFWWDLMGLRNRPPWSVGRHRLTCTALLCRTVPTWPVVRLVSEPEAVRHLWVLDRSYPLPQAPPLSPWLNYLNNKHLIDLIILDFKYYGQIRKGKHLGFRVQAWCLGSNLWHLRPIVPRPQRRWAAAWSSPGHICSLWRSREHGRLGHACMGAWRTRNPTWWWRHTM